MLAVALFILWLTYSLFAVQKLANLPPKRQSFISQFLLLYVVVYASGTYYWVYTAYPQLRPPLFWFLITPVLFAVAITGTIGFSVRRISMAPHPFLS
jgi:nitric oxide reductase large subunit